ncbi:hypothetical protein JCM19232_296 [Vibrio ishigakensis]|uniref:Lipid/polyisoprenoid-binding YceI-like domain-containing protein n=1 Tax=Vibrio ishigakensis TaxID=1481914 RepID=A0A0B8P9X5_9VIBR|nr:hypothetical protein JCM19232_296 [Vibrio ishigakensis]
MLALGLAVAMATPLAANAADYVIDTQGAHASINFKVSHLGYSFIKGRFNKFEGEFSYDPANVTASSVEVTVDTTSLIQTTLSVISISVAVISSMQVSTAKLYSNLLRL